MTPLETRALAARVEPGARIGRYRVIAQAESLPNSNGTRWLCRCDCGLERVIRRDNLLRHCDTPCYCRHAIRGSAHRRFWARVDKKGPVPEHMPHLGPCWLWIGMKNGWGYGEMIVAGKRMRAHRFSLAEIAGVKLGDYQVLHHCDNRACVKSLADDAGPAHLFLGTAADNIHDMMSKGRAVKPPVSTPLTEADVRSIRALAATHRQEEIARMYGITQGAISAIVHGKRWGHVQSEGGNDVPE